MAINSRLSKRLSESSTNPGVLLQCINEVFHHPKTQDRLVTNMLQIVTKNQTETELFVAILYPCRLIFHVANLFSTWPT